jgi:anti-anti-sigma factor
MCCGEHELAIDIDHGLGAVTVVLRGELDLSSHARVRRVMGEAIEAAARAARCCVVDASGVDYIDCSSLRALASLARRASDRNVEVVLCRPAPIVLRMLRLTGYDRELRVVSSSGPRLR